MTPQQRHIEAAEKIVEDLIVNGGFVLQRYKSAKIIALALADAENRAAWDGWRLHEAWVEANKSGVSVQVFERMESTYGPRPSQEVKHE